MDLDAFEQRLGYRFRNRELLALALTHSSRANELAGEDSERLEFVGDAVVDLVASRMLFEAFPQANEGELSRRRAAMVNEQALAAVGRSLGIGAVVQLGKGEREMKGEEKPVVLADAVEAVACAILFDAGYDAAEAVVRRWLVVPAEADVGKGDPKSRLQEFTQKHHGSLPEYVVVDVSGPPHEPHYTVTVAFDGSVRGRGEGRTKRDAERVAAAAALEALHA